MVKNNEIESINKTDLDLIIQVNTKAIEIQNEVAEQYSEVLENQEEQKEFNKNLLEKIDSMAKDVFQTKILFLSGLISLAIQLFNTFKK